jgi:hypothetical protein
MKRGPVFDTQRVVDYLLVWVYLLLAVLVVLLVRRFVGVAAARKKYDPEALDQMRAELVSYVKRQTADQGTDEDLRGFWKGQHVSAIAKVMIIRPILKKKILIPYQPKASKNEDMGVLLEILSLFWDAIAAFGKWLVPVAPRFVHLSQRDWQVMLNEHLSSMDLLARYDVTINKPKRSQFHFGPGDNVQTDDHSTTRIKSGRDTIGSGVSGGSRVEIGEWHAASRSPKGLRALAAALRLDAGALEASPDLHSNAHRLAEQVEEESTNPNGERVPALLERVAAFVAPLATIMTESHKIIMEWLPTAQN